MKLFTTKADEGFLYVDEIPIQVMTMFQLMVALLEVANVINVISVIIDYTDP
jgi:hypothetical protein